MIAAAEFPRPGGSKLLDRLAQLGVPLADLTADSRAVKMGSTFVAYPGTVQDGRAFISEAIEDIVAPRIIASTRPTRPAGRYVVTNVRKM